MSRQPSWQNAKEKAEENEIFQIWHCISFSIFLETLLLWLETLPRSFLLLPPHTNQTHTQFLLHPLHNLLNRCLPASRCCSDTQMIMSSLLFSLLQHSTQPPHPHDPRFATPSLTSYVQHRSQFVHSSYSIHRSRAKYIRGGKKHSSRKSMIEWVRVERIAKLLKCLSWCFVNKMKLRDFFIERESERVQRGGNIALDCVRFIEHRTISTEYLCSTNTCERAKQLSSSSLPPFWAAAKLPLKE